MSFYKFSTLNSNFTYFNISVSVDIHSVCLEGLGLGLVNVRGIKGFYVISTLLFYNLHFILNLNYHYIRLYLIVVKLFL